MQKTARAKRFGFLGGGLCRDIDSIGIVQLGDREPMKSRGVLIQIATSLKIQLTTEQFAYRALHARETRTIGPGLASSDGHFLRGQ
jgi:hypothetical protein